MSEDTNNQEVELSKDRQEAEELHEEMIFSTSAKTYYLAFLDDGHGSETPGKRTPVIKELGRSIKENEFNSAVVDLIAKKVKPMGIVPILVAPGTADRPLKERTDFANKTFKEYQSKYGNANVKAVYISVHYDALSSTFSSAEGHSIYIYPGTSKGNSGKLANDVAGFLKQGTKQQWRGVKESNFHVLRETSMPAILTENGFMSNKWESLLMLNKDFQQEVATEHTKGIAKYFGITYKEDSTPATPAKTSSSTSSTKTHAIKKGDTFYSLAEDYKVTVKEIENANPKADPKKLQIGQKIKIPVKKNSSKATTHKIKKGDTFYSLASHYDVSVAAIKKANPKVDPTELQIGQSIKIPAK